MISSPFSSFMPFLLLTVLAGPAAVAQTGVISGLVSDYDTGAAIADARVELVQFNDDLPDGPGRLADFRGGERQGTWRLLIQDVLDPDTGTLNAWALQITSGGVTTQYDAAGLPAALVDAGEITFTIEVPDPGVIEDVNVTLDVAHSYIGDLTVTLTAPNDVSVVLHAQSGLDADAIQRTYDEESGINREATSGPDGTFSFSGLSADVYSLYCSADFYMSGFDTVFLEEGGNSEVFFNLHYTGCVPISNAFEILGATRGTVPTAGGVRLAIAVTGVPEGKSPQVMIGGEAATEVARNDAWCATDFGVVIATYIVCTVPAHPAGLVDITVQIPEGGIRTLEDALAYVGSFSGAVHYVRAGDPDPSHTGASWETAFGSIQEGVDVATSAGGGEVWVEAAEYHGFPLYSLGHSSEVLRLAGGVAVYGGFNGTETERGQRDWIANATVLTRSSSGISTCTLPLVIAIEADNAVLDGFRLQNGCSSFEAGGMFILGGAPTIRNCYFAGNKLTSLLKREEFPPMATELPRYKQDDFGGGGAVSISLGSPLFENCLFYGNESGDFFAGSALTGGAIYCDADSTLTAEHCTFIDNFAAGAYPAGTVIDGQVTDIAAATLHLRHCIVGSSFTDWSAALDFTPISVTPGVNADVTFCDVIGGFNGEGNLSAYPQFTGIYPLRLAQVQQRDRWESGPEVFQLRTISPCVDAGVATKVIASDFFGQLRPSGAAPDLGFHELRDADTDGADDWWEEQHGLDPADPLDGLEDGDGDTFPAAVEYDIGSDPGDPLDPRVDVYVSVDGDDNAGDGTPENPWRTIGRAQSLEYATRPLYFPRLRVHVGAGVFEEKIETITNTEIVGAGAGQTILQYYNAFEEDQNHVVLRLDADTAVRDCTITLPEEATPEDFVILVRIENVAAEISNVVLDGRGRAGTFGVFISGLGSSASVVRDSSLLNLQTGIQTINTAANITRNFFDGITGVALFVDRPDEKQDGAETTPLVGDFDTAETSGFNSFRDVSGLYVQNNNPDETLAEINDWGVYTEEEIAAKIAGSGAVDFVPFIGKSILSSTLVAGVFDALTEAPIPVERNPVAALDAAQDGSYDPASELHLFPTLVEGNYELTATATGYEPGVLEVEVSGGSIQYAALYLAPTPPSGVDAAETLLAAFAAADTDSSGGLSKAEAQAQIPELNDALFAQLDRDGDGEITQQELEAALPPSPGGCNCDKSTTTFDPRAFLENLFLFGLAAGVLFVLGRRA